MQIQPNQWLLLQQPDHFLRLVQLKPGTTIDLAKYGKIGADDFFGKSTETTYELTRDGLRVMRSPAEADDHGQEMLPNNVIFDDNTSQRLTHEQIAQLKQDRDDGHMDTKQLIDTVISNSDSFAKKNAFAKEKYRRRKESKFARWVRVRECTIDSLVEYHQMRCHEKVGFFRADSMAQLLCVGNVFEGQRVLVFDETRGLVLGAAATLNRTGQTIAVYAGGHFQPHLYEHYNLPTEPTSLVPVDLCHFRPHLTPVTAPLENSNERFLERHARLVSAVAAVQSGQCNSLIIAMVSRKLSLSDHLEPMLKALKPSSQVAVFAPYLDFVKDWFAFMMADARFIDVRLTEPWVREYQTAAGRCHPKMSTSGHGGYVLSATLILP
jgi:hypothetical protein